MGEQDGSYIPIATPDQTENPFMLDKNRNLTLGDMHVVGVWPGKMMKALAAVAHTLHTAYDQQPDATPNQSKFTCLFSSLAVRDFLVAIGFSDATVRTCGLFVRAATKDGEEIHSLGLGLPTPQDVEGRLNWHAVCTVPSLNLLIDPTMHQAIRPAWASVLHGMCAVPILPQPGILVYERHPLANCEVYLPDRDISILWIDRPEVPWRREVDFRTKSPRRRAVGRALIQTFGNWND